jgi:hypothetical protein
METVYKLTIDGTFCVVHLLSDAFCMIQEHEFDNYSKDVPMEFKLEITEMSDAEINALGEFEGF